MCGSHIHPYIPGILYTSTFIIKDPLYTSTLIYLYVSLPINEPTVDSIIIMLKHQQVSLNHKTSLSLHWSIPVFPLINERSLDWHNLMLSTFFLNKNKKSLLTFFCKNKIIRKFDERESIRTEVFRFEISFQKIWNFYIHLVIFLSFFYHLYHLFIIFLSSF